jgi:hypothetical protein
MPKTAGHIIKEEDVKLEGQFRLDVTNMQSPMGKPEQTASALVTPQVRIAQSQPEFAVIEVTCSCGRRTDLRCEYTGARAPEGPENQNGEAAGTDQTPNETE